MTTIQHPLLSFTDDFGNDISEAYGQRDTDALIAWTNTLARWVIDGTNPGRNENHTEDVLRYFGVV